jgi:TonB family protein
MHVHQLDWPMQRQIVHAVLFAILAAPVAAQTVQGTVVSPGNNEARRGAHVALLDDSLRVVRETDSDSTLGAFYLDAPRSGRYSLAVYDRLGNPYASAPFQLDSGAVLERQVTYPALPPALDSLPVAPHLRAGPPERRLRGIRYPESERAAGHSGHVRVAFIVTADGLIEPGSLHVIEATNGAFARAASVADDVVRFPPASADGRASRVVTQVTFAFNMAGAPLERGDVVITAFHASVH